MTARSSSTTLSTGPTTARCSPLLFARHDARDVGAADVGPLTANRTVAFDHRGHGRSPAPPGPYEIGDLGRDVLALLDRLGIERAAYCGLSIGGMVGQWLAINAPHRITKLILICTAAHLPPPSAWTERAASVRDAGTPEVVADAVIGRWFTAAFAAANPTLVADYRKMIATTSTEGYASLLRGDLDARPAGRPAGSHRADARDWRRPGPVDPARARPRDRGRDSRGEV